jgi:predicted nucleic acid-binding protein
MIVDVFKAFAAFEIDVDLCASGFLLARNTNMVRNVNDALHARFAERHASRLVTYDAGFKKFATHLSIPIDILT